MDGLEVLRKLREIDELRPVVMISGHSTVSTAVEATKLGAFDFLEKPLSTERVIVTIRNALSHRELRDENRIWRHSAEVRHEIDTPRSNLYKKLEQYRISQKTDGDRHEHAL